MASQTKNMSPIQVCPLKRFKIQCLSARAICVAAPNREGKLVAYVKMGGPGDRPFNASCLYQGNCYGPHRR